MTRQTTRNFVAHGTAIDGENSCQVTVTGTLIEGSHEPVKCKVIPKLLTTPSPVDPETMEVKAITEQGTSLWIPKFRLDRYAWHGESDAGEVYGAWEGVADIYIEGYLATLNSEGVIRCTIYTSPTSIELSNFNFKQRQKQSPYAQDQALNEGITWETPLGEAKLRDDYRILQEEFGIHDAELHIHRTVIDLKGIVEENSEIDLGKFLAQLPEMFDETFWFLSFLCKRRVIWYEAAAFHVPTVKRREIRRATLRRQGWLGFDSGWKDIRLGRMSHLKSGILRKGLFQQLLDAYLNSPYREIIRQAIMFLLVSYDIGYIENKYTSTYTAFEGFVSGLDKDKSVSSLISSNKFKKLRKKLEQVIEEDVTNNELAEAMIRKLPELCRRSFIDLLTRQLTAWKLDISMLWPKGMEWQDELKSMINRRNTFIHQGKMDDYDKYLRDTERLESILELWILKILQCPDEAIDTSSFYYVARK